MSALLSPSQGAWPSSAVSVRAFSTQDTKLTGGPFYTFVLALSGETMAGTVCVYKARSPQESA